MSTKTITMICRDETGGEVIMKQHFDRDCSWMALAYQYYTFLAAMGFRLTLKMLVLMSRVSSRLLKISISISTKESYVPHRISRRHFPHCQLHR